jgi:hypothetical protein
VLLLCSCEYIVVNKIFSTDFNLKRSLCTLFRLWMITVKVSHESVEFMFVRKYIYIILFIAMSPAPVKNKVLCLKISCKDGLKLHHVPMQLDWHCILFQFCAILLCTHTYRVIKYIQCQCNQAVFRARS